MLSKLKKDILDTIFPPRCLNCGLLGRFICSDCRAKIIKIKKSNCPFCRKESFGGEVCVTCKRKYHLSGVVAYGHFRDPIWKEIIHRYKYSGISAAGTELAELLAVTVMDNGPSFDVIVSVPVSRKRLNERGYNQAEVLAVELGHLVQKPTLGVLKKKIHTASQVGLKRKDRLDNLKGAFETNNGVVIKGQRVLLIDDVFTTGATMDECARVLRKSGAQQVWGAVLAKE
jgi:ComF family protein